MRPREYCCCAIPTINAGIYFTLTEQFVAGILLGILSLATPSIVGAVTPSFANWVFGIICFVAGAIQVLGFIGVAQEKPILFRRYISLHSLAVVAAFSVSLAWIILSLSHHSTAKDNCINDFFGNATSEEKTEGGVLCEVFPWVDVGVMGGLWVIMLILHVYLYVIITGYSTGQQQDHAKYGTLDSANYRSENFALNNRDEPYGSKYNAEAPYQRNAEYAHLRKESAASMSDVLSEPVQQPSDQYSLNRQGSYPPSYPHTRQGSYPPPPSQRAPTLPPNAYTEDESPTPGMGQTYYGNTASGSVEKPPLSQAHPGE